eukprot:TRINITY_DN9088_c0_g1_i1.p1 TRINITY_DN9088_c0_g1~~TRINITY_DN9088_c0_g1_i1.p1  ORF type:complete len:244 (-),score=31.94 TRINITY_DN9088_c0_g1_i1:4-735(-)
MSSSSSSSFEGWGVNAATVSDNDIESFNDEINFYKKFKFTAYDDDNQILEEYYIHKEDSVMISGTERIPFVGFINAIYVKKTCLSDSEKEDDEEEFDDSVRLKVNWYYRKSDVDNMKKHGSRKQAEKLPDLKNNELLFSLHENKIKAQFVMHPVQVYFVRGLEQIPAQFALTNNGQFSRNPLPGFYVTKGCRVDETFNITSVFSLTEHKGVRIPSDQAHAIDHLILRQMTKSKVALKESTKQT